MSVSTQRRPGSLTTRLLVAQIGVAVASALTMLVVAAIVGPPLFEAHMHQAGHNSPDVLAHSQEAFSVAGTLALGIGLAIGATGAVMVSVLISRRLRRSLDDLGAAAVRISEGDFNLRVERPDSRELATLADSFNTMAGRLAGVEATRRRLLSDLAHEVRTPLASMAMCVESLEDGAIEPGPEAWQILSDQIGRISRLADDVGQVSAAEEGRLDLARRPVGARDLAATAVLAARDGYDRKGVNLVLGPGIDPDPVIDADPVRIGQVLDNLLSNALRHTPTGGGVRVSVDADSEAVHLVISDTGEGIAEEHLARIFERFYRADSARDRDHGGTGIGLAIARAIARAHGGDVTAISGGPGAGAAFTVRLPRLARETTANLHQTR